MTQLCALQMRQILSKTKSNVFNKTVMDCSNYLPKNGVDVENKNFRKNLKVSLKKIAKLTEIDCMFKFFDLLSSLRYYEEKFHINSCQDDILSPIVLVVGPHSGIYINKLQNGVVQSFKDILEIRTNLTQSKEFGLQLQIARKSEMMFSSLKQDVIENLAILIDGYVIFYSDAHKSIWIKGNFVTSRNAYL